MGDVDDTVRPWTEEKSLKFMTTLWAHAETTKRDDETVPMAMSRLMMYLVDQGGLIPHRAPESMPWYMQMFIKILDPRCDTYTYMCGRDGPTDCYLPVPVPRLFSVDAAEIKK